MYTYGRFMLRLDRKQQNSVKQLSFNKKKSIKKKKYLLGDKKGKSLYGQRHGLSLKLPLPSVTEATTHTFSGRAQSQNRQHVG